MINQSVRSWELCFILLIFSIARGIVTTARSPSALHCSFNILSGPHLRLRDFSLINPS